MKFYIGIDVGGTNIRGAIVNEAGELSNRFLVNTSGKISEFLEIISSEILKLLEIARHKNITIEKIGIGLPGIVDTTKGVVVKSPHYPAWNDFNLVTELGKKVNAEFLINNDANYITLGEKWKGAAAESKNVVCLILGTGIGGGIVVNNHLVVGKSGFAGELGHITVEKDGPSCNCGNSGCLEMFCSNTAITYHAKKYIFEKKILGIEPNLDAAQVFSLAEKGVPWAIEIFEMVGRYLGIGVAAYINIFNPDTIIIGGGVSKAWDFFQLTMFNEIPQHCFKRAFEDVKIRRTFLNDDSGILGACYYALQNKRRE